MAKDVPERTRMQIIQFLLASKMQSNGKPAHGAIGEAVTAFKVSRKTITRLWNTAKQQRSKGEFVNVSSIRANRIRKKKHEPNYEEIEAIPVEERGTLQNLSDKLKISKSTLGRWANEGQKLRAHTNNMKSLLTASNMRERVSFSLQAIHYDALKDEFRFKPMENTIHIDEKWFLLTRDTCRYYLTPTEPEPLRVCKSKNFIPKVMFMCAVSRPVIGEDGSVLFDGKLGIWPFTEEVTAKRDNINRKRGTKELKPIQKINRDVIRDCLIKQIVPTIKEKWPTFLSKNITIQQDNARPHIKGTDAEFNAAANTDGFHMKLVQQPPNSPLCNALDLGYFNAIQSLQQRKKCKNSNELIKVVEDSFNAVEPMTLNKVFLSLQCVMIKILEHQGKNNFNPPHMGKDRLIRQGMLPSNLLIPKHLVMESIEDLIREEATEGLEELMDAVGIIPPQNGEGLLDLNF